MIPSSIISQFISAVLLCPQDVIESQVPMIPPLPSSWKELRHRQSVNKLLNDCWNRDDGFRVSSAEELQTVDNTADSDYYTPSTYGEVTPLGARQLFHQMGMRNRRDIAFFDLGSGAGKLVVQARLELMLTHARGIELAKSRHDAALRALAKVRQIEAETLVELMEGDLFGMDLSGATHVYVSSLCFDPGAMKRLGEKLQEASNLKCVASLREIPGFGNPVVRYIEMSWTKPKGLPVYFYYL